MAGRTKTAEEKLSSSLEVETGILLHPQSVTDEKQAPQGKEDGDDEISKMDGESQNPDQKPLVRTSTIPATATNDTSGDTKQKDASCSCLPCSTCQPGNLVMQTSVKSVSFKPSESTAPSKSPSRLQKKSHFQVLRGHDQQKSEVEEYDKEFALLKAQLQEAQMDLARERSARCEPIREAAETSKARVHELEKLLSKATTQVDHEVREKTKWQAHYTKARHGWAACEKNLEKVQQELLYVQGEQASKICHVQETAFKRFEDPAWKPPSNKHVEQRLQHLDQQVKIWCKAGALGSLKLLSNDEKKRKQLLLGLRTSVRVEDGKLPQALGDDKAWVLLQAALVDRIYSDIFDQPFFFLGDWMLDGKLAEDQSIRDHRIRDELALFYSQLEKLVPKESCEWRLHLMRSLDPPTRTGPSPTEDKKITQAQQRVSDARATATARICQQFLKSGAAQLLKEETSADRLRKLEGILLQASKLAYSLWAQKKTLMIKRLVDFDKPFDSNDPSMEAHQLHRKLVDSDARALDGKPVLIVAHPAVIVCGYTDESDVVSKHVLKPAICWMAESLNLRQRIFGA